MRIKHPSHLNIPLKSWQEVTKTYINTSDRPVTGFGAKICTCYLVHNSPLKICSIRRDPARELGSTGHGPCPETLSQRGNLVGLYLNHVPQNGDEKSFLERTESHVLPFSAPPSHWKTTRPAPERSGIGPSIHYRKPVTPSTPN